MVQRGPQMEHPLQWEFAGGKLKEGENASQAIVREIKEELGVEVEAISELTAVEFSYPNKKIVLVPVICEIRLGEILLKEHVDAQWMGPHDVKKHDILEADRLIIHNLKRGT